MSRVKYLLALFAVLTTFSSSAASAQQIKTVFVIAMENHNWTQPEHGPGKLQQIYRNPNAPFLNNLVSGSAVAMVNGSAVKISEQVAYATAYHNVLATPSGNNPHIHPSEPSYIWAEAGTNVDVLNDNDPYQIFKTGGTNGTGGTNQNTSLHLSALLTKAGKTWKSYQEDTDLTRNDSGELTNIPLPQNMWTVPLSSLSGRFTSPAANAFNGSSQYNYAAKHNPMVFFTDTNGGNDATPANPLARHYAPLQQLMADLSNGTVADYNWITPDQYNDMHTAVAGVYKGLIDDAAKIRQGDDFLSQIIPAIMASEAYKNNGAIILWWDESENESKDEDKGESKEEGAATENPDDFKHTIPEIVISPLAKRNVNGLPYASSINYTHSSDLRTMQEIFHVGPYLGDAANATDLSDLFQLGSIPKNP